MKFSIIAGVCGCTAVVVFLVFFLSPILNPMKYDLYLDPFKDPQDLFTMARVTVQNTGNSPLTNVMIDYDGYVDKIGMLKPGQKVILSPPQGNKLEQVTVTSDEGIKVSAPYRLPTKMPGMMGS